MPDYKRAPGYPRKSEGSDGSQYVDRLFINLPVGVEDAFLEEALEYAGSALGSECPFNPFYVLQNIESAPSGDGQFMYYDLTYGVPGLRPIVDSGIPVVETQGAQAGRAVELAANYRVWWNHALVVRNGASSLDADIASMIADSDYYKTTQVTPNLKDNAQWIKGDTPIGWSIYSKALDRIKNGLEQYLIPAFTMNEYYLYSDQIAAICSATTFGKLSTPAIINQSDDLAALFYGEFLVVNCAVQPEGKAVGVRVQYQFSPWVVDGSGDKVPDPFSEGNYLGGFDHDIYREIV